MDQQLVVQLGALGALVLVLVGLVVALRTGTLVTGRELERIEKTHAAALAREQQIHDGVLADARGYITQWQAAHATTAESLRTALDANELLAQQADRLVSGTELTQRLIEAMRAKVDHD